MPCSKAFTELFAVERRAQGCRLKCEVLLDQSETGRERLREFSNAETMHAALAFTHGLMSIFGPVVHFPP